MKVNPHMLTGVNSLQSGWGGSQCMRTRTSRCKHCSGRLVARSWTAKLLLLLFFSSVIVMRVGHCPGEGVLQQTVLCTSKLWYLDSVWQEGPVGHSSHPSMPGHHGGGVTGGVAAPLPCQHYRQLRVMYLPTWGGKERAVGWGDLRGY